MIGFLIVHGKLSGPNIDRCSMHHLNKILNEKGYLVDFHAYPWANERIYNEPIEIGVEEIQAGIARLRTQGATTIHMIGHSIGGNIAIYYASLYNDFDSLILLCPAHNTHIGKIRNICEWSIEQSKSSLENGQDNPMHLVDFGSGRVIVNAIRPSIYISYFDSAGICNMTANAKAQGTQDPINVLCLCGELDPATSDVKPNIYDHMSLTDHSQFITLPGETHQSVCQVSTDRILEWVSTI
jgi:pimeloyl-ACP methyl ester carboxylesterase